MENKTSRAVLAGELQLELAPSLCQAVTVSGSRNSDESMGAKTGSFSPDNSGETSIISFPFFFFLSVKAVQVNPACQNRACFLSSKGQHTVLKSQ